MGSMSDPKYIMPLARSLNSMDLLKSLDISGCGLNQHATRIIGDFIILSVQIRELNLSHGKLSNQATRYIINAMNRNKTIRNFNFSHNDLSSTSFEFSIKVASMISRHAALSHLNIA